MKREGFTLFEILLAVSILSIGIIAISQCFMTSASALHYISDRTRADSIIADKIWEMKDYVNQNSISGDYVNQKFEGSNPVFNTVVKIKRTGDQSKVYAMEVTVSWAEGRKNIVLAYPLCIMKRM